MTSATSCPACCTEASKSLLTALDNLRPTLDTLRARQAELLPTFRSLILLGKSVQRAAPGDYLNISGTIQFLLNAPPARPQRGGVIHAGSEPAARRAGCGDRANC